MNERSEFKAEMARIIVSRYKMNPDAHAVVAGWGDWDCLFNGGFRTSNSGEALQYWLADQ